MLAFANYTKGFLLEADASKEGLGDRQYYPIAYGSQALTSHEKKYHLTKLKFLVLKWVVTEQFPGILTLLVFCGPDQ